jgi:hypothetical protein
MRRSAVVHPGADHAVIAILTPFCINDAATQAELLVDHRQ